MYVFTVTNLARGGTAHWVTNVINNFHVSLANFDVFVTVKVEQKIVLFNGVIINLVVVKETLQFFWWSAHCRVWANHTFEPNTFAKGWMLQTQSAPTKVHLFEIGTSFLFCSTFRLRQSGITSSTNIRTNRKRTRACWCVLKKAPWTQVVFVQLHHVFVWPKNRCQTRHTHLFVDHGTFNVCLTLPTASKT